MEKDKHAKWVEQHEYLHGLMIQGISNAQKEIENNFELIKKIDTRLKRIEKEATGLKKRIRVLQGCMGLLILILILIML